MSTDTTTIEKHAPVLTLTDEMCERAWDAYCEARDQGDDEPKVVMRAALEGAFKGVPMANYSIGTLLQFFDYVICLKAGGGAGVYRATGPEGFDALAHSLNLTFRKDGALSSVQVAKIGQEDDGA